MTLLISMLFGSSRGHIRAGSYLTNLRFFGLDFPVEPGTLNTDFLNELVPTASKRVSSKEGIIDFQTGFLSLRTAVCS